MVLSELVIWYRLILTSEGRKTMARGLALLAKAFGARLARLLSAAVGTGDTA
jgi:hypothetical protein